MDAWTRLRDALDQLASHAPPPPATGRVGAALALLWDSGDGDLAILYTRRRDDLSHHPGQISFPGGRVDPPESIEQAALREAEEECAVDPSSITLLGRLPAFYIPPSRFWLQVVVGRWEDPHPLVPAEAEVAEILTASLTQLRDERRWRAVHLSARGDSWAWQLDDGHLLWGATAIVTAVLLGMLDPDWNAGMDPAELLVDREVRPWERAETAVPRPGPARITGVAEVTVDDLIAATSGAEDDPATARTVGEVAAQVVGELLPHEAARVLVLCGPGRTGVVGAATAVALNDAGVAVRVVHPADTGMHQTAERLLTGLPAEVGPHDGELPAMDLTVDALVGKGLDGPLRGGVLDVALALTRHAMPIVSIDLPSGLHPVDGLVGDTVTADVTLALGAPAVGLFGAGLGPFVGDLYLIPVGRDDQGEQDPIMRIVPGAGADGWRE